MSSPLLTALRERQPFRDCPAELIDDEGRPVPCRLSGTPYHDESSGGFAGYRGTARRAGPDGPDGGDGGDGGDGEDGETARRLLDLLQTALGEKDRLERQLGQLETEGARHKADQTRISALAPELRSPLSAILAFSEIIRDRRLGDDPEGYAEHAEAIHRGARHLLRLLSRASGPTGRDIDSAGEVPAFEPGPLDVGVMVRSVVTILSDEAAAAEVHLSTVLARDLPEVRGDTRIVHQILFHLIGRVIALAPAGTTVLVRAELETALEGAATVAVSVVEGVAAETVEAADTAAVKAAVKAGGATRQSVEPTVEAFEDATVVVLRHLAETMDADLSLTGRPGQGGQAVLRLPPATPERG